MSVLTEPGVVGWSAPGAEPSFGIKRHQRASDLEEPPQPPQRRRLRRSESTGGRPSMVPWVISARSAEARTVGGARLLYHAQANPGLDPIGMGAVGQSLGV